VQSLRTINLKRALKLFKEIKENRIIIHTCWFIISEAMTVLLYQYGYSEAMTFNQNEILMPVRISVGDGPFGLINLGHRFSQISTDIWFFVAFNILVIRVHPCPQK